MAFDSESRRQYLSSLRERAVERMRKDEDERLVSRRDTLKWVGLAAVGAAAGVKPLRVAAEGPSRIVGALRARAAMMGSGRAPAPQYGVPALPQPEFPLEASGNPANKWDPKVLTAESRDVLGTPGAWVKGYVAVFPADGKWHGPMSSSYSENVEARAIYYGKPWSKAHAFEVISNPTTGMVYVAPGGQQFYIEQDGELWGFLIRQGVVEVRKSFYRMHAADKPIDAAILGFVKDVSDRQMEKDERERAQIELPEGFPKYFADAIEGVSASHDVVSIRTYQNSSIQLDWKAKTVVSSTTP